MNFFDNKNRNIATFSPDFEQGFGTSVLTLISKFLDTYTKPEPRLLGLITQKQAQKELSIINFSNINIQGISPYIK